jgi:hypothetical protein
MEIDFQPNNVDPHSPLLYKITVDGAICYIGCANSARRPKSAYLRNLYRMIDGKPYRKNNPDGFRSVHRHMFEAVKAGKPIVIDLLRNVSLESKFSEEKEEIQWHLNKGEKLFNDLRHTRSG